MHENHEHFINRAIELATQGMDSNSGGPFGAVVVKNGEIIAEGHNRVTSTQDPTAHAEVVAIREACKVLNTFQLDDCVIYTSCEPCPMCLGAIYWARPKAVYYACNREDAAHIGFDDQLIYDELDKKINERQIKFIAIGRDNALKVFERWQSKGDKTEY
ncbi:nucleoside deaminase [uncultured Microscilla sp.]|uniref:nucleoside deaminase n=1 Tax=uncultured Microscilla sp. TaxID=432653 RepID=UPI002604D927|nr:nucleoside deaminase [uncultured Microscilla sp.]